MFDGFMARIESWTEAWTKAVEVVKGLWDRLQSAWEGVKSFFGAGSTVSAAPSIPEAAQAGLAGANGTSGSVDVRVRAEPGTSASIDGLRADTGELTASADKYDYALASGD